MTIDSLFWLGSCTKLLTSIAVLQCVDRGQLALDEEVTRLLPELKDIEVQTPAAEEGGVQTKAKAKNTITLRYFFSSFPSHVWISKE